MITSRFPPSWRTTVTVHRPQDADKWGNPVPRAEHEVDDCLVSSQASDEDPMARSDAPDTTAWLFGPVSADIGSRDWVEVPAGYPGPTGRFQVNGKPAHGPLGTRVQLKEL